MINFASKFPSLGGVARSAGVVPPLRSDLIKYSIVIKHTHNTF